MDDVIAGGAEDRDGSEPPFKRISGGRAPLSAVPDLSAIDVRDFPETLAPGAVFVCLRMGCNDFIMFKRTTRTQSVYDIKRRLKASGDLSSHNKSTRFISTGRRFAHRTVQRKRY